MSTAPLPSWEDYFIPGTQVLRNKFGVSDAAALMRREEAVTKIRAAELAAHPIRGTFDHDHLKAVHRHLFQDAYHWAGQPRGGHIGTMMTKRGPDVVSFAPGDPAAPDVAYGYLPPEQIEEIAHKVFHGLARDNNLAGLRTRPGVFVDRLAYHWNLVNSVHSFREGNTRTQFAFFHQLSDSVGFRIDTEAFKPGGPLRVDFVLARYHGQATGEHTRLREVLGRAITEKPGPPVWAPTRSLSQMLDHARNVAPNHAARIPIPPPDHRRDHGNQVGL